MLLVGVENAMRGRDCIRVSRHDESTEGQDLIVVGKPFGEDLK